MKSFKGSSFDNVDRVDNVSERFRHFATVSISDHGVAEDFVERHLVGEVDTEEYHSCDPEEENVPTSFEY